MKIHGEKKKITPKSYKKHSEDAAGPIIDASIRKPK